MQEIKQAINDGALFVINHSGGKDSQAMMISLVNQVPREQLLVVHSTLGQHEWPGALEHAQQQAGDAKVEFRVAQAGKSFFDMVDRRFISRPEVPCWPGDATRQCTSDLKRDPVKKVIRNYAKEFSHTRIINCMGLRAQESAKRAKKPCYACDKKMSVAGRLVHAYFLSYTHSIAGGRCRLVTRFTFPCAHCQTLLAYSQQYGGNAVCLRFHG